MARKKQIPTIPMNVIGDWAQEFGTNLLMLDQEIRAIRMVLEAGRPDMSGERLSACEQRMRTLTDMWCGNDGETG